MNRATRLLGLMLALSALAACAESSSSAPAGADDFLVTLAQHLCHAEERCGRAATFDYGACLASNQARYEDGLLGFIISQVESGEITYHRAQATACLDAVDGLRCGQDDDAAEIACESVFVGQGEDGDECLIDEQCAAGAYCDDFDQCPGMCRARAALGESCDTVDCQSGLDCSPDIVCTQLLASGARCSWDSARCQPGLRCLSESGEEIGLDSDMATCKPPVVRVPAKLGETCGPGTEDHVTLCDRDLACIPSDDQSTYTCKARVARGKPCHAGFENPCEPDSYCARLEDSNYNGVCRALPQTGEPCTGLEDLECTFGLECSAADNLCHALARIGDPCTYESECASYTCQNGECAEYEHCP
jgi:hypothetical protein